VFDVFVDVQPVKRVVHTSRQNRRSLMRTPEIK